MDSIDFVKTPVTEIYGSNCFNAAEMRSYLSADAMKELSRVRTGRCDLSPQLAEEVAAAMKTWALSKGATHYTHWFQPLTGLTAEKHDSFINPERDGTVLMEFSGKELLQGESDASSFPNGGLRATFEARGYTAWDTSSPAFIKDINGVRTLYIPTAFFSFTGEALDKKVPLLRSVQALEKQTLRVLKALGNEKVKYITVNIGPEQEYFLVDRKYYEQRPDLRLAGRTVFGNLPAKGQELHDHYYGTINDRVAVFMKELNYELWKLGIPSKSQHKEVAPNQFELAVVYDAANIASDHNQLLMDVLKSVSLRHGMVALLHEKPFDGVNGSGKHVNWSISTDDGQNLLSPGDSPEDNVQFLLFLTALIKTVDVYAPLLRAGATNAGNDYRLGDAEAPPTIISVYLGEQLTEILDAMADNKPYKKRNGEVMKLGATALPKLPRDMTDRNRTSPFAFTGNKFEFRMVGSSQSTAGPNTYLNAAVAQVLEEIADRLEGASNKDKEVQNLICEMYRNHRRVIFNGNGYSQDWKKEAKKRGLPSFEDTVSALPQVLQEPFVQMFEQQKVLTRSELESRLEIYLETYSKQINIEAGIMVEMVRKGIIPAVTNYLSALCESITKQEQLGFNTAAQKKIAQTLSGELNQAVLTCDDLHVAIARALAIQEDALKQATIFRDAVREKMEQLRSHVDTLETFTDKAVWPFPPYEKLLFKL